MDSGDTTTAGGRLVLGIFAALAKFERELIRERTIAGLSSAQARLALGDEFDLGGVQPTDLFARCFGR